MLLGPSILAESRVFVHGRGQYFFPIHSYFIYRMVRGEYLTNVYLTINYFPSK